MKKNKVLNNAYNSSTVLTIQLYHNCPLLLNLSKVCHKEILLSLIVSAILIKCMNSFCWEKKNA